MTELGFEPRLSDRWPCSQPFHCITITTSQKDQNTHCNLLQSKDKVLLFLTAEKRKKEEEGMIFRFEYPQVNKLEIENQESLWPNLESPGTPWILPLKPHWSPSGLFLVLTRHHFLDQ